MENLIGLNFPSETFIPGQKGPLYYGEGCQRHSMLKAE